MHFTVQYKEQKNFVITCANGINGSKLRESTHVSFYGLTRQDTDRMKRVIRASLLQVNKHFGVNYGSRWADYTCSYTRQATGWQQFF